jgi:hypothetical protein
MNVKKPKTNVELTLIDHVFVYHFSFLHNFDGVLFARVALLVTKIDFATLKSDESYVNDNKKLILHMPIILHFIEYSP